MASSIHQCLSRPEKLINQKIHRRIPAPVVLLQMCRRFHEVKQLHAHLIISGLLRPPNAGKLLESYVSVSQIGYALSVFNSIPFPDVFAYNTMIRGLMLGKHLNESLFLFVELLNNEMTPDNYTYVFVLKACSHLQALSEGKQVHAQIIKAGIAPDTHVHSSLIHMYSNSGNDMFSAERVLLEFSEENMTVKNSIISGYMGQGNVAQARIVFDAMTVKDVASWSGMVSGYTKNRMYLEALDLYQEMIVSQLPPNESTLVSALSACAHLGALDHGKWIHSCIIKSGTKLSTTLGTALVEMYAKCGSIQCGYQLFDEMPDRDVVTWGALISGFASYGHVSKCKQLFDEMIASGTQPNAIIFVSILSACSHAGFVDLGLHLFKQMVYDFQIRPSIEHYGCMVDLLSRAGLLGGAEELILSMPEKPNSIIWGTLLSACRTYNDTERGYWALRHLNELEPNSGDRYKLAGLMYANAGQQKRAIEIRKFIKENHLETTLGKSFIEVDGKLHEFMAGDLKHEGTKEMYRIYVGY